MAQRSWLFVPGDSERKLAKATSCGADVLVIDLEDAVAPANKGLARQLAADWLKTHAQRVTARSFARWVRINPLAHPELWREDLAAVMAGRPDGIMVPKASGPEQLRLLTAEIYELEPRHGVASGTTRLMPMVAETPAAALSITSYAHAPLPRLAGLTWGAEDLAAAMGAQRKRTAEGSWTDAFRLVRSQPLLTAHALGVPALDAVYADFSDTDGLARAARDAFMDGFTGMLAIHPAQVPVINAAFTLDEAAVARAWGIVEAFAAEPGAGALGYEGAMIERPHLEQARRLLDELP